MCVASLSIFADAHLHIHHSYDFARTHMFVFLLVEVWLYKDVFTLFHLHVCKSYLTVICYKFIDGDTWATVAFTTNFNPRVFHTYPFPLSPCITVWGVDCPLADGAVWRQNAKKTHRLFKFRSGGLTGPWTASWVGLQEPEIPSEPYDQQDYHQKWYKGLSGTKGGAEGQPVAWNVLASPVVGSHVIKRMWGHRISGWIAWHQIQVLVVVVHGNRSLYSSHIPISNVLTAQQIYTDLFWRGGTIGSIPVCIYTDLCRATISKITILNL